MRARRVLPQANVPSAFTVRFSASLELYLSFAEIHILLATLFAPSSLCCLLGLFVRKQFRKQVSFERIILLL